MKHVRKKIANERILILFILFEIGCAIKIVNKKYDALSVNETF